MDSLFSSIRCLACDHPQVADLFTARCAACGSTWLDARYDYGALPRRWTREIARRPTDLWRYRELLPIAGPATGIRMGEGWTPLTRADRLADECGIEALWIKDERQQPTGSFKDRQAALTIAALQDEGIDELVVASTGNAAAAYAAYCARAGLKLWIFLTGGVPAEKLRELGLYGAEVVSVTGSYDQTREVAADFARRRGILFDRGARAIPGKESMKTIAYEIAEQLDWQAPDWYVQAVSGGIGPLGVLKGFVELFELGLIDRVPRIGIVQPSGCAPMVRAWTSGADRAEPVHADTLITGLSTGDPGLAYTLLRRGLDEVGGAMVAVDDGESFRAMRRVARLEGLSVEPAGSVAFAGLARLVADGAIRPDQRVVINASGHTFSAEKHALEDRYVLRLEMRMDEHRHPLTNGGLGAALQQLDEQVTTIAIIDDNPHDSRLLRRLLQGYRDYRIFEAHNGPDGVDLVVQRQPDLVILDLTLPEMDGFSILSALRDDPRTAQIPVIIISAKSLTSEEEAVLDGRVSSIWQKGNFSAEALINHVLELLGESDSSVALSASPPAEDGGAIASFGNAERSRVLIIDDNLLDSRLMRRLFEARHRFDVRESHSAREALALIERWPPDLIILDLLLPDTDGLELLGALRGRPECAEIPIVIVSARDLDASTRARLATQADSVWTKAVLDRSSLLSHIETILPQ